MILCIFELETSGLAGILVAKTYQVSASEATPEEKPIFPCQFPTALFMTFHTSQRGKSAVHTEET